MFSAVPLKVVVIQMRRLEFPYTTILVGRVAHNDLVPSLVELDLTPLQHVYLIGCLPSIRSAVYYQLGRTTATESLDAGHRLYTLACALADQMKNLFPVVPIGFIEIEGILLCLSVVCNQSFVIPSHGRAFTATGRGEVEHTPDEVAPKERALL